MVQMSWIDPPSHQRLMTQGGKGQHLLCKGNLETHRSPEMTLSKGLNPFCTDSFNSMLSASK